MRIPTIWSLGLILALLAFGVTADLPDDVVGQNSGSGGDHPRCRNGQGKAHGPGANNGRGHGPPMCEQDPVESPEDFPR